MGNKAYRSMEMHSAGPLVRDILPASIAFPFKTVQYNSAEHTLRVHTHIIPKRNTASYSMIRLQSAVVKTQITRPSVMSLELPPLVRFGAPLSFLSPRGPLFQSRGFSIICTYKYKSHMAQLSKSLPSPSTVHAHRLGLQKLPETP